MQIIEVTFTDMHIPEELPLSSQLQNHCPTDSVQVSVTFMKGNKLECCHDNIHVQQLNCQLSDSNHHSYFDVFSTLMRPQMQKLCYCKIDFI